MNFNFEGRNWEMLRVMCTAEMAGERVNLRIYPDEGRYPFPEGIVLNGVRVGAVVFGEGGIESIEVGWQGISPFVDEAWDFVDGTWDIAEEEKEDESNTGRRGCENC